MAKFVYDNCCFCVDLRVGCFIFGYISLVLTSILGIFMVILVGALTVVVADSNDPDVQSIGPLMLAIAYIGLVIYAVFLIFIIALLAGLHKNKPGLVKAYMIYNVVFLVLQIALLITNISTGGYTSSDLSLKIVSLVFNVYMLMVIRSYYYVMLEQVAPKPNAPPATF